MDIRALVEPCDLLTREVREFCINLLDVDGCILTWNEGGNCITGYTFQEVKGKTLDFLYPRDLVEQGMPARALENARRDGTFRDQQWRRRKAGDDFWADEVLTALHDERGNLIGFLKIVRDLTERRRIEEQLRQSEQRYRDVVEGVQDYAIFLTDLKRNILSWNPAATRIVGFTEPEILGQSADILFTPEDRADGEPQREAQASLTKGRAEDERWHMRSDGTRFWASGIMTARYGDAGEPIGFIKIMRDRTERKHAEEELQKLNETLEQRVGERTQSLLTNQRQLRQLASELGKAEQRERYRLAQELHDHLVQMLAVCVMKFSVVRDAFGPGKVPRAADELRDVLQDALTYSRTLMTELSPLPLDVNDIVEAIEWVAARMKQHGLSVTVTHDRQPKPLSEDFRTVLFQSVRELLYNVVKHARVTEAQVSIVREGDEVAITVSDRGAGFTVTEEALRPTADRGFGLFNIRERLALLGGRLDIESAPGRGTRSTLRAPLLQPAAPPAAPKHPAGHKVRVMLVDDHRIIRRGLRGLMESQPDLVVVAEAGDGAEALETARIEQPDVIVMDVNMPVVNGVEATRRIKRELPGVEVVALTVHEDHTIEKAMRDAGAAAYQQKGGIPEDLFETIRAVARR